MSSDKDSAEEYEEGEEGEEPFCQHGNLLWSEDCDDCDAALWAISEAIDKAQEGRL